MKLISTEVFGAAYLPNDKRQGLRHIVDANNFEAGALCKKVKPEHCMDDSTQWGPVSEATCTICLKRAAKIL